MPENLDERLRLKKRHLKKLENGESLEVSIYYNFYEECMGEQVKPGQPYSKLRALMDNAEEFYKKAGISYTRVDYPNTAQGAIFAGLKKDHIWQLLKEKGLALIVRFA